MTRWPGPRLRTVVVAAFLVLLPALVFAGWLRCSSPTTLLIVRHADRAGREDALSPLGLTRAAALAHAFAGTKLAAIYHSDTRRARDTAAPLASALGLLPSVRPAADVSGLVGEIVDHHRGEQVLIVGHSNTVPQIIRAFGGPPLPDLPENEFDNLFVLTACRCFGARAHLVRLQYGEPSPSPG